MSQYVEFFVRGNNDAFVPIGSYSRSNPMYQAFVHSGAPYEKIAELDNNRYRWAEAEFEEQIKNLERVKRYYEDNIEIIKDMKEVSLDEKLETINEYRNNIEEAEEDLKIWKAQLTQLNFINRIRNEYIDDDHETRVYVGIEVGTPTIEDIVTN